MKSKVIIQSAALILLTLLAGSCGGSLLSTTPEVKSVVEIAVTSLTVTATETTATIAWSTTEATTHFVEYGTVSGTYTGAIPQSTTAATSHSVTISGLSESTTYYYRVTNLDSTLYASPSAENSFATSSYAGIHVTGLSASAAMTAATLTWTTDVATTHVVEYGTSSGSYALATTVSSSAVTAHTAPLSGLTASTTYYYRILNYNTTMPSTVSAECSFTTTATDTIVVSNLTATATSTTTVDITWTTNVATTHLIEYGTTSGSYTNSTILSSASATSHSVSLTGLTTMTTYYFRVCNYASGLSDSVGTESSFQPAPTLAQRLRGIWMIGGLKSYSYADVVSQVDLFDPVTGAWYTGITTLPTPVSFAAAASLSGNIYVIGGFTTSGTAQSIVQIYSVSTDAWTTSSYTMPLARANISAAVVNGKIYILGGTAGAAVGVAWSGSTTTYEYTPDLAWNSKVVYSSTSLTERLSLAFNDVVYNLGGRNAAAAPVGTHDGYSATYDATTSTVTEIPLTTSGTATSLARTGLAGVVYTPESGPAVMAIVGGFSALTNSTGYNNFIANGTTACTTTYSNLFQYINYPFAATSSYWKGGGAVYPESMGFASAALYGSKMYVFGGTNSIITTSASGLSKVYWFDLASPESGAWTAATSMPVGRYGHVAVTINQ